MGRPKKIETLDLNSDTYICKFCRKKKKMDTIAMEHIGEGVCHECMVKGW